MGAKASSKGEGEGEPPAKGGGAGSARPTAAWHQAHGQNPRAARRAGAAASSSPKSSPARSPASPLPRSSRGCSRSTTRSAPARIAAGSGRAAHRRRPRDPRRDATLRARRDRAMVALDLALLRADPRRARQALPDSPSTTNWKDLPKKVQDAILYGSGDDEIRFTYDDGMRAYQTKKPFEGVITNLERRYKETESDWAREEHRRIISPTSPAAPAQAAASSPRRCA